MKTVGLAPPSTAGVVALRRWLGVAGMCALGWLAGSCSVVRTETQQTAALVKSFAGKSESQESGERLTQLQMMVMRQADQYTARVADATDSLYAKAGTPDARTLTQGWKLQQATSAYIVAVGENPALNAVDMVILATVSRMVVQDYWVGERFGAPAQALLATHRELETNAWATVDEVLTPAQRSQLRQITDQWRAENPRQRNVGAARFSDFVKLLGAKAAAQQNQGPGSLFSLALVNPLSGLDPAVRALEQTRQLAARAMYYAERAPRLWSWQAELLTYQLADQPESRQVLSNLNGVADSTQSFARTAESLPNLIRQEREAAINQLLAGVAQERSNILATLNTQEAQLRELLPQVRQTLTAGRDMANSVNGAVKSLDAFVHYVSPPDTNATPQPAATNSRPFNVLDYGTAAGEIGGMAKDLNTLLTGLNQSLPQVTRVSQQATVDAKVVVTHAFRLGLVLIVVLGLVAVLVVALCRRLGAKVERAQPTPVTKPE
jgi:hypothetical protein